MYIVAYFTGEDQELMTFDDTFVQEVKETHKETDENIVITLKRIILHSIFGIDSGFMTTKQVNDEWKVWIFGNPEVLYIKNVRIGQEIRL